MVDRQSPPYEAIGRRIRSLREIHDLTQTALAALCWVAQPTVSKWETGQQLPSRPLQHRIADVLKTSRSMLFREVVEREAA